MQRLAPNATHFRSSKWTLVISLLLAIAMGIGIYLVDNWRKATFEEEQRVHARNFADELREMLKANLLSYELKAHGLVTAFKLDSDLTQNEFSTIAKRFYSDDEAIVNLAFLKDAVVQLVYPYANNEKIVGFDLRKHGEQFAAVEHIHTTGQTLVQGPLELIQDNLGLIIRMPVESAGNRSSVAVVINANAVLQKALRQTTETHPINRGYLVGIKNTQENNEILGEDVFDDNPLLKSLSIPGTNLVLGVVPELGWGTSYKTPWMLYSLSISLLAFVVFAFVYSRRQALERQHAQSQLNTAIDSIADGFVLYDEHDCLVTCNKQYVSLHDKCAEAIIPGARFEDILRLGIERGQFPEAIGQEEAWLAKQLQKPSPNGTEFEVEFDKNRWIRIFEKLTPSGGRVGFRIDVTKQVETRLRAQQAEDQAQKSKNLLLASVESLPDGFVLYDANDELVLCNSKYKEFYSLSAEAMKQGASFESILRFGLENGQYKEALGREEEWLEERLNAHAEAISTVEQRLGDGRWLRILEKPTPDGGRVGIRVDVTELKEKQRALEDSNKKLRDVLAERDEATKRFSDVAELSNDWFWEQDCGLRFTFVSDGFDRNLDLNSNALLGSTYRDLYSHLPDVWESADWEWLEAKLLAKEPFDDFVYRVSKSKDDSKWIRISGTPIETEDGQFDGYRGVGTDVSVLYNALRGAEAAILAKTEFLNTISHELRTPLTVVMGFNAYLEKPELLPTVKALVAKAKEGCPDHQNAMQLLTPVQDEVARFAKKMRNSGEHLLGIINDMLDLAKIDSGKLNIEVENVHLSEVISSVVDQFSETASQRSIDLLTEVSDEVVLADELRLRQILINLVGNALKFTDEGFVSVCAKRHGDKAVISVNDSGCGIPEEKRAVIFEQFSQADSSAKRRKSGTGLGLAISRRLVEMHGGELTLTSEVDVGSTFEFSLPSSGASGLCSAGHEAPKVA